MGIPELQSGEARRMHKQLGGDLENNLL